MVSRTFKIKVFGADTAEAGGTKPCFYLILVCRADVNQAHPARRSRGRQKGLEYRRGNYTTFYSLCAGAVGDSKVRAGQWNVLDALQLHNILLSSAFAKASFDGGVVAVR